MSRGDIRRPNDVRRAVNSCRGVVHLAAVSRVPIAERDPAKCWTTNVAGTRIIVEAVHASPIRPWLIFASSREVFGQPRTLPATEATPIAPRNVYGHSKSAGELLILKAELAGLRAAIVRISNVYGWTGDHPDRVVPAFTHAAAVGDPLRVEGSKATLDFIHIDDVVRGLICLIARMDAGRVPPPINLVGGNPTTLLDLARLCVDLAGTGSRIVVAAPQPFRVSRFYGDPARARALIGWRPRISLIEGVARLIRDFKSEFQTVPTEAGL